jgi:Domain of unknown function (DUF4476)
MKKNATLSLGILLSIASFANFAPNRLTVSAEGDAGIKVTVDGSRFNQQLDDNSVVFENLNPGYHAVKVYQVVAKRGGWFGRNKTDDYRLMYTGSVNIKPLFETSIVLNRFGKAYIDEQPIRGRGNDDREKYDRDYDNHDYGDHNDRRNGYDHGYENADSRYNNNGNSYSQLMNNDDFFAVKRMLEREGFDNTRLVIAKHIVDVNALTAIQVKEMARLFSFDNSKLDFVKYAYTKTIDKNNFVLVCDAFSFGSSKEQLIDYIRNCR